MNEAIMQNVYNFIQVIVWSSMFIIPMLFIFFITKYKYIVELNIKTGSGVIIKNRRAKLVQQENRTVLKPFGGKMEYKFPSNNEAVYKKGMFNVIRFYCPDQVNYFPIILNDKDEEKELKAIPQELLLFHAMQQKRINEKYKQRQDFMQQYGAVLGIGMVVVAFIIVAYFLMERIDSAIDLGNTVVQEAARLRGQQTIS